MKKQITATLLLVALLLSIPEAFAAGNGTITLSSVSTEPSGYFSLTVTVDSNPGVMFLSLTPVYDTNMLELISMTDAPSGWTVVQKANWDGGKDETFTGKVLTLNFKARANISGTTAVRVTTEAYNHAEQKINFSVTAGTVNIQSITPPPTVKPTPTPTPKPTPTPTPKPTSPAVDANIYSFVYRCYSEALGRTPAEIQADSDGVMYWYNNIKNGLISADYVGYYFVFSPEGSQKGQSNNSFVTMLYRLYMNRTPDKEGLDYWDKLLNSGTLTRENVNWWFCESAEWRMIKADYGMK